MPDISMGYDHVAVMAYHCGLAQHEKLLNTCSEPTQKDLGGGWWGEASEPASDFYISLIFRAPFFGFWKDPVR